MNPFDRHAGGELSGNGRRAGFTLVECIAAIAILGVALVVTLQLQLAAARQRRAVEQRQLAGWEVANLMERLSAEPYADLTSERARLYALSTRAAESLRGARLAIEVAEALPAAATTAGSLPAKRLQIRLAWHDWQGQLTAPVRLTAWVFRPASDNGGNSAGGAP